MIFASVFIIQEICEQYNGEDIISLTVNGVVKRDLTAGGKMPTSFDGYQYVEPNNLLLCLFDIDVTPRCVGVVRDYGVTSPAYSRFVMHDGYYNAYYDYLLRMIDDNKVFVHLSKNLRSSLTESDFGAIKTRPFFGLGALNKVDQGMHIEPLFRVIGIRALGISARRGEKEGFYIRFKAFFGGNHSSFPLCKVILCCAC